ncbi:hypothetical protein J1N35_027721 [Gossypium stocksii]|uniref:Uncharacterized protein n=1 Tax=Gossypium stocksii TaxID=47602 RepID=A0A9D4A0H3_9ROSI|nr:hypothetical protein J1N35_027721 [Gossypium stocksii]
MDVKVNREPIVKVKNRTRPSTWQSPIVGCVKMNIDGTRKPHIELAYLARIAKDNHGRWIFSYGRNIRNTVLNK